MLTNIEDWEELACVLGEEVKDVETRISDKNRKMPLIPKRFRQLLGLRRVYEVDGVDASAVCSAVRMFLLRVASGGKWTHWGMIQGPVTVELPLRTISPLWTFRRLIRNPLSLSENAS